MRVLGRRGAPASPRLPHFRLLLRLRARRVASSGTSKPPERSGFYRGNQKVCKILTIISLLAKAVDRIDARGLARRRERSADSSETQNSDGSADGHRICRPNAKEQGSESTRSDKRSCRTNRDACDSPEGNGSEHHPHDMS